MSTKIYNGIKFKSKDYHEVISQLRDMKKTAVSIANGNITSEVIDKYIKSHKLQDSDPFSILDSIKKNIESGFRDDFLSQIDFNFYIIIYPSKEGDIYGYYFNELNEHESLLYPLVDDFCYYDNSDQPDDISDDEWDFRCNKWDELIPDDTFNNGFKFQIVGSNDIDSQSIRKIIRDTLPSLKRDIKIDHLLNDSK